MKLPAGYEGGDGGGGKILPKVAVVVVGSLVGMPPKGMLGIGGGGRSGSIGIEGGGGKILDPTKPGVTAGKGSEGSPDICAGSTGIGGGIGRNSSAFGGAILPLASYILISNLLTLGLVLV